MYRGHMNTYLAGMMVCYKIKINVKQVVCKCCITLADLDLHPSLCEMQSFMTTLCIAVRLYCGEMYCRKVELVEAETK